MARKITSGPVRNVGRTKKNLVDSVGKVLKKKGYPGLIKNNIANEAGVDRKLITYYFGNLNKLIDAYVRSNDYWNNLPDEVVAKIGTSSFLDVEAVESILIHQFDFILRSKEMQKIVHWQLGDKNSTLRKVADERELLAEELYKKVENSFEGSDVDFKALAAILIGGIYATVLHTFNGVGGTFCGLDLKLADDQERIKKEIIRIINFSYKPLKHNKRKHSSK